MGKTAVLISGEHRFLDQCLPTMKFVQDADVYFSFWNISKIQNTVLGIDCEEYVDASQLVQYTPRERILVESTNKFQTVRYNDKMIYRWKQGLNMIRNSGVEYDHIIITRPDLYFGQVDESELRQITDESTLYVAWHNPNAFLQDCLFAGTSQTIYGLIDSLSISDWQTSEQNDWHTWWTDFVRVRCKLSTASAFPSNRSIFFRPSKTIYAKGFDDVLDAERDWRDSKIIEFADKWGYEGPTKAWGEKIVQDAILAHRAQVWNRPVESDTLVVFSGAVRNYHTAVFSHQIWKDCHKAVVTWDSQDARSFAKTIRANHSLFFSDTQFCNELQALNLRTNENVNASRMVFLLQRVSEFVRQTSYSKIIVVRPDVFYWESPNMRIQDIDCEFASLTSPSDNRSWAHDLIFVGKRQSVAQAFDSIFADFVRTRSDLIIGGNNPCTHSMLGMILESRGIAHKSQNLCDAVFDVLIQRDTYKFSISDQNNYALYLDLFHDTASWWKRVHGMSYESTTKRAA